MKNIAFIDIFSHLKLPSYLWIIILSDNEIVTTISGPVTIALGYILSF